jgi:hypothetical protein
MDDQLKIIKITDSIRLRPEADFPLAQELIGLIKHRHVIVKDLNFAPVRDDSEPMPLSHINALIPIRDHLSYAPVHSIETDILFKQVCPGEIVVPIIHGSPN